jgi:hypothetical protein
MTLKKARILLREQKLAEQKMQFKNNRLWQTDGMLQIDDKFQFSGMISANWRGQKW